MAEVKERPIPFNAEMVRAILTGAKTQTRRICKAAKDHDDGEEYRDTDGWPLRDFSIDGAGDVRIASFGQPGERLWVRETWAPDPPCDGTWGYTAWAGCKDGKIAGVPEISFFNDFHTHLEVMALFDRAIEASERG